MEMLWVDPVERVRGGHKRHTYSRGNGAMLRDCKTSDGFDAGSIAKDRDQLTRVEVDDYCTDPNACQTCIRANDLSDYAEQLDSQTAGAESVDVDPFGVFTDDN